MQHLDKNVGIVSGDSLLLLGFSPILLTSSTWLGQCWWGVVGIDSSYEGTMLMFRVALDLRGIAYKGFCLLSLSFSQLPSEVANLNVVGLYVTTGWATSCHVMTQRF